jgi:hypothetical protein
MSVIFCIKLTLKKALNKASRSSREKCIFIFCKNGGGAGIFKM